MHLPLFVGVLVFLVCITLCPFQFCNHLEEEEKVGCFAFGCLVIVYVLWLLNLSAICDCLFPDHTHFFSSILYKASLRNIVSSS